MRRLVMVFAGGNNYMIGKDFIDQTMFLRNTAGPISRPISHKRFRLACSVKRITHYFCNKCVNFLKDFFIFYSPFTVFGKSGFFKANHCAACSSARCVACSKVSKEIIFFPRSIFSTALFRCSRLAGEAARYSVSFCSRTIISMFWSGYASLTELINSLPNSLVLSRYTVTATEILSETQRCRNPALFLKQCQAAKREREK